MHCSNCSYDCPAGMRFCGRCGGQLHALCPTCDGANPPDFAFCGQCGGGLGPKVSEATNRPALKLPDPTLESTEEVRQITVMFCDLVGSTALSEELEPDDLRELILRYQQVVGKVVERLEGYVAQYLGDGILLYFGYPHAHEDSAQRAVLCGLKVIAAIDRLNDELKGDMGRAIALRVGIHTGVGVIAEMGSEARSETLFLGQTPNVAARVEGQAQPGTVVLSDSTYQHVQGMFAFEPLGSRTLKGVSKPIQLYRALRETAARSRFEVTASTGLRSLVGRQTQLRQLMRLLDKAAKGRGQVIELSGEPGIGKSHMQEVLRQESAGRVQAWWTLRSAPYFKGSALHPFIEGLQRQIGLVTDEADEGKQRKIEDYCERLALDPSSAPRILAGLMSLPTEPYGPSALSAHRQREATLEFLVDLLLRQADKGTMGVAIEDLHWIDASSLELIGRLISSIASRRVLLLLSYRPSFRPPWADDTSADVAHITRLELGRLERSEVADLLQQAAGGYPLPEEVVRTIQERSAGVPLFAEELLQSLLRSGRLLRSGEGYELSGKLPDRSIPNTLQDSLTARLDALDTGKEIAQLGAVLGGDFRHAVVSAITKLDDTELGKRLWTLVSAGLLGRRGKGAAASYYFRHALIQDAAYESLPRRRRGRIHAAVGNVLAERFPETARTQPELLAHHFSEAGELETALEYAERAGNRATERWAHREACRHFEMALGLLPALPSSEDRSQRELRLLMSLGVGQAGTRGYSAPEVEETYGRAQELCRDLDSTPFPVLWGLWAVRCVRGERRPADEMVQSLRGHVERPDDSGTRLLALSGVGTWHMLRGDYSPALDMLLEAKELFSPELHRTLSHDYGGTAALYGHNLASWVYVLSGRLDEAERHHREVLDLARELGEPYALTECLTTLILLGSARDDVDMIEASSGEVAELAEAHDFAWLKVAGQFGRGYAIGRRGGLAEGLAELRAAHRFFAPVGQELLCPYYSSFLVESLLAAGEFVEALTLTDELLAMSRRNLDSFYEGELHRLRGELLQKTGDRRGAEAGYREGYRLSAASGATVLALRAATSLARMLAGTADDDHLRTLRAAYDDAAPHASNSGHLEAARELLDELGG